MATISLAQKLIRTKKPELVLARVTARMAELRAKLEVVKPLQDEYDELKDALVELVNRDYEPDDEIRFDADNIEIVVSQKEVLRRIKKMSALYKYLGRERFLEAVTFPLKQFDALVPKKDQAQFIVRKRVGPRCVKVTLI